MPLLYSKQKSSFSYLCFCLQFLQFNNGQINHLLHSQHRIAAQQLIARECNLKLISQQCFSKTIVLEEFWNASCLLMSLSTVRSLCRWNNRSTESYTPGSFHFCPHRTLFSEFQFGVMLLTYTEQQFSKQYVNHLLFPLRCVCWHYV